MPRRASFKILPFNEGEWLSMTREQIKHAELMRCQNMTWTAIGKHFGVSSTTVRNYVYPERRTAGREACKSWRERKKANIEPHVTRVIPEPMYTLPIPREVLIDRDRRMAMQPQSLTAQLLGDPLAPDWHKRS